MRWPAAAASVPAAVEPGEVEQQVQFSRARGLSDVKADFLQMLIRMQPGSQQAHARDTRRSALGVQRTHPKFDQRQVRCSAFSYNYAKDVVQNKKLDCSNWCGLCALSWVSTQCLETRLVAAN